MAAAMARDDVVEPISQLGFVALDWGPDDYERIVGSVHDQLEAMGNALQWERDELAKLQ